MNRRNAMSVGVATLFAAASAEAQMQDHAHHHHQAAGGKYQALADASADCVLKGQACLAHCLVLLADGDKEMAACAQSVSQAMALCGALQSLAVQESTLVAALAKTTLAACEQCEKECKKHETKHATCKACMESCAACIKQCKAVAA
jgi:Cys-rich four helix bundle protein (predicted Tat secretion target)